MRLRTLGIVLAGGKGTRLYPLTRERAKPAVPFGGKYRIIDFVLSNFINSGIYSIYVLTQFRSQSLLQHLSEGWQFGGLLKTQFLIPVPAQMRSPDETWYQGTADAIYQNINLVEQSDPHVVAIFGADHIYRMNIASMIDFHVQRSAEVTVAAIPVSYEDAKQFGVIEADADGKILAFHEKSPNPPTMAGDPTRCLASMGNYVFNTKTLIDIVSPSGDDDQHTDIGGHIIPALTAEGRAHVYDFSTNVVPGQDDREKGYWRDVGTIDSYYDAQMDLISVHPVFNLYNYQWPIYTDHGNYPPAKFVFGSQGRVGEATDSAVSPGVVISGGHVSHSVLSPGVHIHSYAKVTDSVLLDFVQIGENATIHRAIIDKNVIVPDGVSVGVNRDQDLARGFTVTDSGITVIGKSQVVRP